MIEQRRSRAPETELTISVLRKMIHPKQSQASLADLIGVSQSLWSMWEHGTAIHPLVGTKILELMRRLLGERMPDGLSVEDLSKPWAEVQHRLKRTRI